MPNSIGRSPVGIAEIQSASYEDVLIKVIKKRVIMNVGEIAVLLRNHIIWCENN